MTRREYTDTVLSALRRVTEDERRAIRAEIDAHMEDHICALLDLGYDEPLAEERTVALMDIMQVMNSGFPFIVIITMFV